MQVIAKVQIVAVPAPNHSVGWAIEVSALYAIIPPKKMELSLKGDPLPVIVPTGVKIEMSARTAAIIIYIQVSFLKSTKIFSTLFLINCSFVN